jgi:hypothetical protein
VTTDGTSVREDLGYSHAPARAKPPPARIVHVKTVRDEWPPIRDGFEAMVLRSTGKVCFLFRATEREARAAALKEVRR